MSAVRVQIVEMDGEPVDGPSWITTEAGDHIPLTPVVGECDGDIIIPASLSELNQRRCDLWHDPATDNWTLGDWGNAFGGEAGELQNVVKKLRRHQSGASTAYNTPPEDELRAKFCEEVADVLLYLDLLRVKAGFTCEELLAGLRAKFNEVSVAQGWTDLLWDGAA